MPATERNIAPTVPENKAFKRFEKVKAVAGPLGCNCPTCMAKQGNRCVEIATGKCRSPGGFKKLKRGELPATRSPHQSRDALAASIRLLP